MEVHVICCNDSLEAAIVDDGSVSAEELLKRVDAKLQALKQAYFDRNRHVFTGGGVYSDDAEIRAKAEADAWESYSKRCYWHSHVIGAELP